MQNHSRLDCTLTFRFERKPNHCSGCGPFYYVIIIHKREFTKSALGFISQIFLIFELLLFVCLFLSEMWSTCSCTKKNTWRYPEKALGLHCHSCQCQLFGWRRTPKVSDLKPAMVLSSDAHLLLANHLSSKCHVNYYFGAVEKMTRLH